jgi:chromosome segregation ATPase
MYRQNEGLTVTSIDSGDSKTSASVSPDLLEYNSGMRSLNFLTDLLADKMDVLKRKAETYAQFGYSQASKDMQQLWQLLHNIYQRSGADIRIMAKDARGQLVDWPDVRAIQFAMDRANAAMLRYGQQMLNDNMNNLMACQRKSEENIEKIRTLNMQIQQIQEDQRIAMSEKVQMLANIQKKVQELEAELVNCMASKRECEDRVNAMLQEAASQKNEIDIQIQNYEDRLAELNAQLVDAENNAILGLSTRDENINALSAQIEEAKVALANLEAAKSAADSEIAVLQAANEELEVQLASSSEPLTLEISSYTSDGDGASSLLNLTDKEAVAAELAARAQTIENLKNIQETNTSRNVANIAKMSKDLEDAKAAEKAAETKAAAATTARNIGYSIAALAILGGAYTIYKNK